MNLELSIVIPDKIFFNQNIKEMILPTLTGKMGVLKGHIPLLTGLDTGLILVRVDSANSWISIVVSGGFALINKDVITVLVNEAELASKIDRVVAEKEFLVAKNSLESAIDDSTKLKALLQFKKARAKLQALESLN